MKKSTLNTIQNQKVERIKELLEVPCEDRTEKMCLELMSFTKVSFLFHYIHIHILGFQAFRKHSHEHRTSKHLFHNDSQELQTKRCHRTSR